MYATKQPETLANYEELEFARYFANDIRYPYVSYLAMAVLGTWLLRSNYPDTYVALWLLLGFGVTAWRECLVRQLRPQLAAGMRAGPALRSFTGVSLALGMFWGIFVGMHVDPRDPMRIMLAGAFVTGHIGGAVTPLSSYLPAFYAFAVPVLLPGVVRLAISGEPLAVALAGLSMAYFSTMSGYAHITNRLHRESMRLRFDNQRLIADLEQRNAEVESASRNKSLFLAGVSHDLKQPIRAIGMYTGFLRHSAAKGLDNVVTIQTAEKIEAAASAVHRQISRLLELSRLESGAMPVHLEVIQLTDVLLPVYELLAGEAKARGVQLRLASGRSHRVWADRRMLESVLTNFISNALKHAEGGRVYVGTRLRTSYTQGQQLCIEVRDNGAGIPEHQLPLLFDAYRSFDDRHGSESHGLGLALAKAQASFLGCEIDVSSRVGCGSTFTLCGLRTA